MKDEKKTQLTQDPARSNLTAQSQTSEQPPTPSPTQLPAAPTVRVKLLRDCAVRGQVLKADTRVEVSEAEAEQLCRTYPGHYDFFGELNGQELAPVPIQKARRLEV